MLCHCHSYVITLKHSLKPSGFESVPVICLSIIRTFDVSKQAVSIKDFEILVLRLVLKPKVSYCAMQWMKSEGG